MIYSLTVAPAIDYTLDMEGHHLRVNGVNRPESKGLSVGGKGIKVSRMLNNLKIKSLPIIAVGGSNGKMIEDIISKEFTKVKYLPVIGESRIDVLITGSNIDLRFDPPAPKISDKGLANLYSFFEKNIKENDIVVLAGSTGQESKNIYANLIKKYLLPKKAYTFLDTSGEALALGIKEKPFFIKPNEEELADLLHKELTCDEDIIVAGQELRKQGPQSVLVTMGNRGAYYFAKDDSIYHCTTAVGKQISAVGAGDSSIAGFIKGLTEGKNIETCLTYSMAAGSATAFSKLLGSYSLFKSLVPKIKVTKIK